MFRFATPHNRRPFTCIALLALLLSAIPTMAAQPSVPITITADTAKLLRTKNISKYTGNVVLKRGGITLTGSKLIIKRISKDAFRAILTGHPATLDRQPTTEGARAISGHADRITFTTETRLLVLHGDAVVKRSNNIIRSAIIRYDLDTKRIVAEGTAGGDGRVKITLHPNAGSNGQP